MTLLKGHKFASICHVHIIFCNNTRYVPLKIGHYIGSPFLFQYNELPLVENITLHKHCLWDILHVASICHVHIIFCNNTRYVPLKIGHYIGSPFLFQYNELPLVENITLHKHCLWDILHVEWDEERIHYKDRSIPLREHLNVPLKDKIRLRWILKKKNYQIMYMVKQGDTWYNLTKL